MPDAPFPTEMMSDIRNFFEKVHPTLKSGQDVYKEVLERPYFFPLQRRYELAAMMWKARSIKPTTVVEIGADKGGSLYHWCMCLPTVENVIAVEIRGTPYKDEFEKAFGVKDRIYPTEIEKDFLWVEDSSYNKKTLDRIKEFLGETKIDCLFIDGDKTHFVTDFDSYRPFMARNGIIFMHDITDHDPKRAYEEIIARGGYDHQEIIDRRDTHEAIERAIGKVPSASAHESWLRYWQGRSCGLGVLTFKG